MKFFIEHVTANGCKTKNDKGAELYYYCADTYEHLILDSEEEISNIINDINRKICELNDKYPRLRQKLKVEFREFEYCDFDEIVVRWVDNSHSTCCIINLVLAKGILVDGVVRKND